MRLQKYIAKCGVTSRRKAEGLIEDGKVEVNGIIVTELGSKVDPERDRVKVNGKNISLESKKVYIMVNKPVGYVTTLDDENNRPTVIDLLENVDERVYPVGRLDIDTTGLLLLTNDGDITYKLTHPSNEVDKKYIAIVEGNPNKISLNKLRSGVRIDGKMTSKALVKVAKVFEDDSILEITIKEGRNRQVKKMCEAVGHPVKKLKRVSMGKLELGGLDIGNWRYLDEEEVSYLKSL